MANIRGDLPLSVTVGNQPRQAHSTYAWSGGGTVLTISTVVPERGLAVELVSTYVGHTTTGTVATHLMLGPAGHPNRVHTDEHAQLNPAENARECAHDHARMLIEHLRAPGRDASVQLDELSFAELERVE